MLKPTPDEIERGLTDEDENVRVAFAGRNDYTPTPAQIERGLTDKNELVRIAFAGRRDYTPTLAQVERALANEDGSFGIYFAWHLQNIEIAPAVKTGIAFDRRRYSFDRRQQHYAAYTNCARISSRRTKSERCPSPGNMNLWLCGSLEAI